MYKLLIPILLLFLNINLFATEDKPIGSFSKAIIRKNNYQNYIVHDVTLFQTNVTFVNQDTNMPDSIPINQIQKVMARTGNKAFEGAISGGVVGLLIGWRIGMETPYTGYGKTMLISSAVSAGIFTVIGFFVDDYDVVYYHDKFYVLDKKVLPEVQSFTLVSYSLSF